MNYSIKLGSFTLQPSLGNEEVPVNVEIKDVELSVTDIDLKEIPALITTVKGLISEMAHKHHQHNMELFEVTAEREDTLRKQRKADEEARIQRVHYTGNIPPNAL